MTATGQPGLWDKGNVANGLSLVLLLAGLGLTLGGDDSAAAPSWLTALGPWVTAVGLFGFAGGITNWLAVKMLFDRVPGLYGSGVIPNRFREIRATIKDLIMTHFFDEAYLRRFFEEHGHRLGVGDDLPGDLRQLLSSEAADAAIVAQLEKLQQGPFGMLLRVAGTDILKAMVRQFLEGLVTDLGPTLAARLKERTLDAPALRAQIDRLLEVKLEELTPQIVKRMMEQVMREHLGWLILWGNVFGGAIGLVSRAAALHWDIRGVP